MNTDCRRVVEIVATVEVDIDDFITEGFTFCSSRVRQIPDVDPILTRDCHILRTHREVIGFAWNSERIEINPAGFRLRAAGELAVVADIHPVITAPEANPAEDLTHRVTAKQIAAIAEDSVAAGSLVADL